MIKERVSRLLIMLRKTFLLTILAAAGVSSAAVEYPGASPGVANASQSGATYTVSNEVLSADFSWKEGGVYFGGFKAADGTIWVGGGEPVFRITLADMRELSSADMVATAPQIVDLKGDCGSLTVSKKLPGKAISSTFTAPDGSFSVEWRAVLRDGSHYLRQEYTIKASGAPVFFNTITPLQVIPTAAGGTPTVSGNTPMVRWL